MVTWVAIWQRKCMRRNDSRGSRGAPVWVLGLRRDSVWSCSCVVTAGKDVFSEVYRRTRPREVVSVESN